MPNDDYIIEEAIRLVDDGVSVTLPVDGRSMLPFIIGGRERVILQKPGGVKVGDVVLARVHRTGGQESCANYVVHRIIGIDGDRVTLMGDGNLVGKEYCMTDDIKAIATHVVDGEGRQHDLYCGWRRMTARLWWQLRPIRRYLLAIYRRL